VRALRKKRDRSNVFVGFMFLGMGLGWLLGHLAAGLFIGMGLGFIAQAFLEERGADERAEPEEPEIPEREPAEAAPTTPAHEAGTPPVAEAHADRPDVDAVWARIAAHQGETFHLLKGQPFTYRVEGHAVVPSTAKVRIQKSQFAKALGAVPFEKVADVPKDVFGPSYVYAILMDPRIRGDDW